MSSKFPCPLVLFCSRPSFACLIGWPRKHCSLASFSLFLSSSSFLRVRRKGCVLPLQLPGHYSRCPLHCARPPALRRHPIQLPDSLICQSCRSYLITSLWHGSSPPVYRHPLPKGQLLQPWFPNSFTSLSTVGLSSTLAATPSHSHAWSFITRNCTVSHILLSDAPLMGPDVLSARLLRYPHCTISQSYGSWYNLITRLLLL